MVLPFIATTRVASSVASARPTGYTGLSSKASKANTSPLMAMELRAARTTSMAAGKLVSQKGCEE